MKHEKLTFDELPSEVSRLAELVTQLHKLVAARLSIESNSTDDFLNADQAASFLHISIRTLYNKVYKGEVPYSKPGSRLLFERSRLNEYMHSRDGISSEEQQKVLREQTDEMLCQSFKRRLR